MKKIASKLKSYLLSGILVVVPIVITFLVLHSIFLTLDNFLRPYLEPRIGFWFIGFGLLVTLIIVWTIGVLANNILIKKFVNFGEIILYKIPIAKIIYSAVKQLLESVSRSEKQSFQRVVLVEYPGKDIWSIGFVNGETLIPGETEKKLNILIMASINPTSGFFIIISASKTIPLAISVEEGMKWVISGGIIKPKTL